MMILGMTTEGQYTCLTARGDVREGMHKPDRIILGLGMHEVMMKRIWVDAHLTDEQNIIFLRHHMSDKNTYLDYECIKQDQGRVLLHVYEASRMLIQNYIKRYRLVRKNVCIETSLHGMGRALIKHYALSKYPFHCIAFLEHEVRFSVHHETTLKYYQSESLH